MHDPKNGSSIVGNTLKGFLKNFQVMPTLSSGAEVILVFHIGQLIKVLTVLSKWTMNSVKVSIIHEEKCATKKKEHYEVRPVAEQ